MPDNECQATLSKKKFFLRGMSLVLCLLSLLFATFTISAQPTIKKTRILFLLDASSSMTYPWNAGYTRFEVASNILLKIMDSVYVVNNEIEFGVRAYGTMYPAQLQNCIDTRLEVPFNLQNTNQIKTRLSNLAPIGSSPIAYSLKKASENELNEVQNYDYSVIFITDGGESCGGDVCGIYQELLKKKISIKPYIIGLDSNAALKSYYACLGNYIEVSTTDDIQRAVNLILDANKTIIDKPKQLKLVTTYSNVPAIKDTVAPAPIIKDSVITERTKWRIVKLTFKRISVPRHEVIHPVFETTPMKKIESVTIRIDLIEPKKSSKELEGLNALNGQKKLNAAKVAIKIKKSTFAFAKKVSLVFEYDEPKKVSPVFDMLAPRYKALTLNASKPSVSAKKSGLTYAKKASLAFEYEEPKKVSPVFDLLAPRYMALTLKSSKPSVSAKKSGLTYAKKASLAFEYEEPKKVSPVFDNLMPVYKAIALNKATSSIITKKSSLKYPKKVSVQFEYQEHLKEYLATLKMALYPKRMSYAFFMPTPTAMNLKGRKVSLHFKIEEKKAAAVAKKDTVMPEPPVFLNNSIEYTTEVIADKETKVQVYFKGTNGKTYPTAKPMISMQDAKTNQTVTSFRRDMNGADPVPQSVPQGTYNLVIKGFDDLYANNIEIKPNTVTKVIVKVSDGTLQFRYQGNIKRPMTEYTAVVNRRFASGATIKQKCSESLMYEPGTYYVEINSLPTYKASIDISFDASFEIQLPEPGTLAIMNSNALGKIQLQTTLGDQFVTFYTMNITGNLNEQRLQLLSNYPLRIVYPVDPKNPALGTKQIPFRINPNNTLELELK
jgi:ubiquitin